MPAPIIDAPTVLFWGSVAGLLGFFFNYVKEIITERVSTKTSIAELRKAVDKMPEDLKTKQDIVTCHTLHANTAEKLQTMEVEVKELRDDTAQIKEKVVEINTIVKNAPWFKVHIQNHPESPHNDD